MPKRKKQSEWMMPLAEAIMPYTPMPAVNASPVEPTSAKAVIVVPNSDINSRNGPIEWLASWKSSFEPEKNRLANIPKSSSRPR